MTEGGRGHFPRDKQDWRKRAKCLSKTMAEVLLKDPKFFLRRGGKANQTKKEFCDHCIVKRHCLAFALFYNEEEGIWGGLTPDERRDLPEPLKELMMLEAANLIDTTEIRDPAQWLPIVYPPTGAIAAESDFELDI